MKSFVCIGVTYVFECMYSYALVDHGGLYVFVCMHLFVFGDQSYVLEEIRFPCTNSFFSLCLVTDQQMLREYIFVNGTSSLGPTGGVNKHQIIFKNILKYE